MLPRLTAGSEGAVTELSRAVFLSYASQDVEAARRICSALRGAGIEVWFDQNDLRGGDVWDQKIRREIRDCALFVPIISANTYSRREGYFRLEWGLAEQRAQMIARNVPFIVPVCVDGTPERSEDVPESFLRVQWTRLLGEDIPSFFCQRISELLAGTEKPTPSPVSARPASPAVYPRHLGRWLVIGTLVVILVAALVLKPWQLGAPKSAAVLEALPVVDKASTARSEKSIAVLPFADMSEKKDQEYFADGMAEEILDALAKIPGLHVIGRTSSFQFKGQNEDLRKIGIELAAAHLVEGSVQRSGKQVRVTVQLIRSSDGAREWSESYEREVSDVLRMQRDIAVSIARALQVTVEAASISASGAMNPDAYDFFLRGLHAFDRNDKAGLEEAINDFQNALQLEPSLARADDALALAQLELADDVYEQQEEGFLQARESAQRLLKQNPRSPHGHVLMSRIYADYDWDWADAKREAEEAIAINPRFGGGLYAMGFVAGYLGKWNEGERDYRAALSLDPLNPDYHYDFGVLLLGAGRYPESVAEFRRAYEISPSYAWSHAMTGIALLALGELDAALQEAQQESMDGAKRFALAVIYYSMGKRADSDAALAQLTRDAADRMAAQIAYVHAYRGENEQAFDWLERAYRQKDTGLPYIKEYPLLLKRIEGDPRYKAFLRKMNLPE
jgi:TolB-like protein